MIRFFNSRGSKKRATVFVDYESWFYAYKSLYGMRPSPKRFRAELEKEYEIEDIMVFGDFSSPGMADELGKLRNITNTIIETGNTFNHRKKDMTDFIMLDYIYQYADENRKAGTYIIFTGDGHFQSVIKYLIQKKKKNVLIYGVKGSISRQLREVTTEVRELPTDDDIKTRYYHLIIKYLAGLYHKPHIILTFLGTADKVANQFKLNVEDVKKVLSEMIELNYISKGIRQVGNNKGVRILVPEWGNLRKAGFWTPEE